MIIILVLKIYFFNKIIKIVSKVGMIIVFYDVENIFFSIRYELEVFFEEDVMLNYEVDF